MAMQDSADIQLGLWTKKIGFHNTWEFWLYNVVFGLGQAPYYAYSQTMMSDLTPPGYEGSELRLSISIPCLSFLSSRN